MNRSITRIAGSFILGASLLAGCGSAAQSPYAPAASRAVEAGYQAAAAPKAGAGAAAGTSTLAWWRRPIELVRQTNAARDAARSAADRLREMGTRLGGPSAPSR